MGDNIEWSKLRLGELIGVGTYKSVFQGWYPLYAVFPIFSRLVATSMCDCFCI